MPPPEFERPPEAVRDHIAQWFEHHKGTYLRIWDKLDQIRERWSIASKEEKEALLKLSYINSVFSIRTPLHIHEEGFMRVMSGEELIPAMKNAGMGFVDKQEWSRAPKIYEAVSDDSLWANAVDFLDAGKIDLAHELLQADAGWLGAAKAPFTLANLGFVEKMCINGNVARLFRADPPRSRMKRPQYEKLCADIRDMFPELAEKLRPYELQWLLFDYQRFYRSGADGGPAPIAAQGGMAVAQHSAWFDVALGPIDHVVQRMEALTAEGKRRVEAGEIQTGVETADVERQIDAAIDRALQREVTEQMEAAMGD